jgi:hypothetical protein
VKKVAGFEVFSEVRQIGILRLPQTPTGTAEKSMTAQLITGRKRKAACWECGRLHAAKACPARTDREAADKRLERYADRVCQQLLAARQSG